MSNSKISRRQFLKGAAAAAAFTAVNPSGRIFAEEIGTKPETVDAVTGSSITVPTNKEINIQIPDETIRYSIVDNHLHFTDFLETSDGFPALTKAMDIAGVEKAVVFGMPIAKQWDASMEIAPSYYLSNDSRCYYYSATDFIVAEELLAQPPEIRERFYPFCCGINGNDRFAAFHIEQLLDLYPNFWCGIGEIMSRHDDLTALTYGEAPHINNHAFLDIFDLAADKQLPVLVHHNITGQNIEEIIYLKELKEALAYNRACKIIWAHIGISRRVELQNLIGIAFDLLAHNENLWVDISWLVYDYYFLDNFPSHYPDGNTLADWVNLIERFPDRFLLGTDKVGHWETYPAEVVKYYALLDKLKPETAEKICRKNVLSLIKQY